MSHFSVLVIGNDPEKQLAPYQENNMDDCPKEYLKFNDIEEEYRKEFENDTRAEFYCSSSSSWGQMILDSSYNTIKELDIGGIDNIFVDTKMQYFKKGNKYRCYPASKDNGYPGKYHIWIEVLNIVENKSNSQDACFKGVIQVKRIDPPKEIPLKVYYAKEYVKTLDNSIIGDIDEEVLFEFFMKEWAGCKKDPETDKYGYWENPNRKWDWYELGGRWTGYFKLKKMNNKQANVGNPGLMTEVAKPGYVDQCKKSAIDFDAMKKEAREEASKVYDKVHSIINERELKYNWFDLLKKSNNKEITIDEARTLYNNQEVIKDFNKEFHFRHIEDFLIPREDYLKSAEDSFLTPFAVVKDGKWYERGSMGWWGMVSDEKDDWDKEFSKLIENLPKNILFSLYDCHI